MAGVAPVAGRRYGGDGGVAGAPGGAPQRTIALTAVTPTRTRSRLIDFGVICARIDEGRACRD